MWLAYASQQGSCDAVPLLCGGLAVQGASPYKRGMTQGHSPRERPCQKGSRTVSFEVVPADDGFHVEEVT